MVLVGCGGKGSADVVGVTPAGGGVAVQAQAKNLVASNNFKFASLFKKVSAAAEIPNDGHPAAQHKLITPTLYHVGMKSARLQNAATNPTLTYDAFDSTVSNPVLVDLTANNHSVPMGSNAQRPTVGTYTHMRAEIVYLEMEFRAADSDTGRVRWYLSNTGANNGTNPQQGDVMRVENGTYKWIDENTGNSATVRPANPVNQLPFAPGAPQIDPFNDTMQIAPLTILATSGSTTFTMVFDVTNTFFFEDFNLNGKFDANGGVEGAIDTWWPGPPTISMQL